MATATTTNSRARKVLATPELLQRILLQLPLLDQFRSTMVNRLFRDTIQDVSALKRDMQMIHVTNDESALVAPLTRHVTTRFWLGDSPSLFDKNPVFLDGQASLFVRTTSGGLYMGEAEDWDNQCQLHFDTAPFRVEWINGPTEQLEAVQLHFDFHGPELFLHEDVMTLAINNVRGGQSLLAEPQGSWAKLKISPLAVPVIIVADVRCHLGCFMFSPGYKGYERLPSEWNYEQFLLTLSPEEATMGNMIKFLADLRAEAYRQEKIWSDGRVAFLSVERPRIKGHPTTPMKVAFEEGSDVQAPTGEAGDEMISK